MRFFEAVLPGLTKSAPLRCFPALGVVLLGSAPEAHATTVALFGSLQSEIGCSADYSSNCADSALTKGATDEVWRNSFALPAGTYSYFAIIDQSLADLAPPGGIGISLSVPSATTVRFYYDQTTHWLTDNINSVIVTLAGDFQSELGCGGDFDPSCMKTWLEDNDGDGIYTLLTSLPANQYSFVVALNESFVPGGKQYSFSSDGSSPTSFSYNAKTGELIINGDGGVSDVPIPPALPLVAFSLGSLALSRRRALRKR
jgi:hypothetical protein